MTQKTRAGNSFHELRSYPSTPTHIHCHSRHDFPVFTDSPLQAWCKKEYETPAELARFVTVETSLCKTSHVNSVILINVISATLTLTTTLTPLVVSRNRLLSHSFANRIYPINQPPHRQIALVAPVFYINSPMLHLYFAEI